MLLSFRSIELQPHYVTRRYAEFAASVLTLHHRLQDLALSDDMLLHNMYALCYTSLLLARRYALCSDTSVRNCGPRCCCCGAQDNVAD